MFQCPDIDDKSNEEKENNPEEGIKATEVTTKKISMDLMEARVLIPKPKRRIMPSIVN